MINFIAKLLKTRRKTRFLNQSNVSRDINKCLEHFCPRCDATLELQEGFSPTLDTWFYRECGQFLYGDVTTGEKYPDVMWYCDRCEDLLNKQKGFSDIESTWICTECGYLNKLDTIIEFKNLFGKF